MIRINGPAWLFVAAFSVPVWGQSSPAPELARQWRHQHERMILDEFVTLLSVPNTPGDHDNIQRNAALLLRMMQKRGITSRLLSVPNGNPVVYGELSTPGATRTLVFYAHYDGSPLDAKDWISPPYEPTLRDDVLEAGGKVVPLPEPGAAVNPEWRLFARSAADDKAPIMAMLAAVDAIRSAGVTLRSNIKFVFDGEEEAGSVNLSKTLVAHRELFAGAAVWLMCDGPMYPTRQQSVVFGSRGIVNFDLTVYGARTELHSGHYGNWAPNPALRLARLLASMKDDQDHVLIEGFYDEVEPLSPLESEAIRTAPVLDADLRQQFRIGSTDGGPGLLNELIAMPSLNIRGLASARIGAQASNVIPASATATFDARLVKKMTVSRTQQIIRDHVQKQGYFVVEREPTDDERRAHAKVAKLTFLTGVEAERTSMELPISQEVIQTVERVRGPAVKLPTMGGQLPLDAIVRPFNTPLIIIPTVNHDNNQHGPNENLRIQNLWDAIETMAALLAM
jgi:acetylornithine deacetylase/succinyl-diaminopimelate desuccinylase-like protein